MSFGFRKKKIFVFQLLVFFLCYLCECVNSQENDLFEIEAKNTIGDIGNDRLINMPDSSNSSFNSTYYSTESEENSKEKDLLFVALKDFQDINFSNGFRTIRRVLSQLQNENCVRDVTYTIEAIAKQEQWALEMLDSFPKFPDGILYGNFYELGHFDECIRVHEAMATNLSSDNDYSLENTIKGQYCLVDVTINKKFGKHRRDLDENGNMASEKHRSILNNNIIHWAICLPSSCTVEEVEILTKEVFSSTLTTFDITSVHADPRKCETEMSLPMTTKELIYGIIVGMFLIFTILATGFHIWFTRQIRKSIVYNMESVREQRSNTLKETIICFSFIKTTEGFFHTKPNELNLECICGIKFLSMMSIIAGHALIFFFGGPISNYNFYREVALQVENAMFINGPILVDTFLLISGFLMCRLLLIELDKRRGKINFITLYIARYIRLTPAYAVVLGLYTTFLYRMGSGPFWQSKILVEQERCQNSWWLNLLYVNNYVGTDNLCMFQSWYLAVDYHLFILAPFVIYPLWRKPKLGETILFFCTVASVVIPFTITFVHGLDPTIMGYPSEVEDLATNFYFVNYYIKTHMRCSSYCIGILYAYLVHKIQQDSKKIPSYIITLGWIFAIICGLASMSSVVIFYQPEHSPNMLENAMYSALHRVGWALSVGWVILVCVTDNAAFVNKFLSYKFFIPASRLTYCAYLANGLVEIYSAGITRQPAYMTRFDLASKVCGHIIMTFMLAFILCIIFESPIHGMEKIILKAFDINSRKTKKTEL